MADEKKASTAVKKGVGRRDTDPTNKTAAQTENGSVEDKLRGAIELIGRVSTEANERKSEQEKNAVPEIRAPYDTDVYCVTCNKTVHVKAGEVVPFCCGRLMEILD